MSMPDPAPASRTLGSAPAQQRPPFVLVHGAWHGGWCWGRVAERLRAAGHRVFTPTLTGLGDRAHLIAPNVGLQTFIEDVVSTIDMEDLSDVVLVGHSYGSAVISGVADARAERIRRLVYLDSFMVQSGQSPFDQLPPDMVEARRASPIKAPGSYGETFTMPAPAPSAFGIVDAKDAAWAASRLRPHPIKSYEDRLELKRPLGAGLSKDLHSLHQSELSHQLCGAPMGAGAARLDLFRAWDRPRRNDPGP
jgi:pimeloyl-ACP methyl ester carboxylesterase